MNGFGLEFFIECPAAELTQRGDDVVKSWQFQLLYTVSQLAAGLSGGVVLCLLVPPRNSMLPV